MESFSDSDDDGDPSERGLGISGYPFDDFRPLSRYSRYGNDSLRSNHRGSGSRRKSSKGRTGAAREVKSNSYQCHRRMNIFEVRGAKQYLRAKRT